eukprot:Selendium_serpulae@DN11277_c0_g1_i1.p1
MTAAIVAALCKRYGVKKVFSTPYHPQGDPVAERFMRKLGDAISTLTHGEPADWDDLLPLIAFSHNTSFNASISDTPFFLVYGRDARLPQRSDLPETQLDASNAKRLAILTNARQEARKAFEAAQMRSKARYDSHQKSLKLAPGDLVIVRKPPGSTTKLGFRWTHPKRVVRVLKNGLTVEVTDPTQGEGSETVHVQRLTRFQPYSDSGEAPPAAPKMSLPPQHSDEAPPPAPEMSLPPTISPAPPSILLQPPQNDVETHREADATQLADFGDTDSDDDECMVLLDDGPLSEEADSADETPHDSDKSEDTTPPPAKRRCGPYNLRPGVSPARELD